MYRSAINCKRWSTSSWQVRAIHYVLGLVRSGCHDETLCAFLYCWVLELLGWLLQFLPINRHIWKRIPSMIKNLETLIMAFSFNLFWALECNWQWFASWVWLTDSHEQMLVRNDRPAQSSSLLLAAACSLATLAILTCSPHVCLPPKPHSPPPHPWSSMSQTFKMVHLWPWVPKSQPHRHCHHEIAKTSQMWDMPTHFPEPVKLAQRRTCLLCTCVQ